MATIKVKFRPSAVNGKAGAVCYQLCHRQENKQITTSMRIFPHWWNPQKRELITTPDNAATVSAYRRQIEQDVHKLREIVRQLALHGRFSKYVQLPKLGTESEFFI